MIKCDVRHYPSIAVLLPTAAGRGARPRTKVTNLLQMSSTRYKLTHIHTHTPGGGGGGDPWVDGWIRTGGINVG